MQPGLEAIVRGTAIADLAGLDECQQVGTRDSPLTSRTAARCQLSPMRALPAAITIFALLPNFWIDLLLRGSVRLAGCTATVLSSQHQRCRTAAHQQRLRCEASNICRSELPLAATPPHALPNL